MARKRTGEPWMPADVYGRSLPPLTVNLIVRDVARSVSFYVDVLGAERIYADVDFAALRARGVDFLLHADHTYEGHAWRRALESDLPRGLGAELRLLGVDPDAVVKLAYGLGALVLTEPENKAHGWREASVQDPDGYVWAVGRPIGGGDA